MKLMTVTDASKILATSRQNVYKLISNGHLKAIKIGSYKISDEEITRFVKENIGKAIM